MKRTFAINILICVCMIFFSCGCDDLCTEITYRVEGTARGVHIRYNNEYGDPVEYPSISTSLPWVKTFKIENRGPEYHGGELAGNIFPAEIKAEAFNRNGNLKVSIYVDGELKATDSTTAQRYIVSATYGVKL